MKSTLLTSVLVSAICFFPASPIARGQGVGASGEITGTVIDPAGAAIPNAKVVAADAERGVQRSALADGSGQYRVAGLPPSHYRVTAEFSGFQTEVQTDVAVTVGQVVTLDFHLKIAKAEAMVEVSSQAPIVETERGHQADTIEQNYIEELPINRRDYLTFTLLMPGVSESTRLASDQDFRVKQTPQSGLSFYGSNGRGNSATVDGGEVNDDSGGVRLTLSQDAVQEFQINRSNYGADLGGASGASINIVSKTGTNQLHGSLFAYFRNDALDARDPFAVTQALQPGQAFAPFNPPGPGQLIGTRTADTQSQPTKDSLSRQQFGGSIGFPITKDKTFLFASFEGLRQDAQNAVPLLTNTAIFRPDATQAPILQGLALEGATPVQCFAPPRPPIPAAFCAQALEGVLTVNPASMPGNQFIVNQFESNGGLFNYDTREYFASGRFDHKFSDNNSVFLRYSFAHDNEQNPDVQSLTGFSRGSSIHAYDNTLQGAWYHLFSAKTQNEARVQWNYSNFNVIPNEPAEVGLDIPGFANLGTNIFQPSFTIMRRYEFADNFTVIRGHHTMKMGFYELYRGNHSESHTFFPGRFVFGDLPGGLVSPCLQAPALCGLMGVNPATINSIQSVSLGLPHFYQQGFGNPVYNYPRPFTAGYWQDSWTIRPNFTLNLGVRYEVDSQYGPLSTDKDNFAPRVSFAWDPFNDHKTVIRGGYGIFYSPIYGQIADVVQTLGNVNNTRQIANFLIPLSGIPGLSSAAIFQTLFAQGKIGCTMPAAGSSACITPADLAQFGLNVTNTGATLPPLTVLFSGQPDYQSPYSQQASIGIEREIAPGFSISVSGIYSHTLRLPVAIDTNIVPQPFQFVTVPLANGKTATYRDFNSNPGIDPIGVASCQGALILSCFVNPLIVQNNQYSSRASALYEGGILEVKKRFGNHFTLMGNWTYSKAFDTSTDFNSDYGPVDNTNLSAERGLSDFDQRHKLVIASVIESPWKNVIVSGFQLSPIFRYNSGHPFNLLAGSVDVNGDNHYTNDRPIGARRNTGLGPNYYDFDMRLSRTFHIREKVGLQLLAEGFNLANRTNYASVNNEVGPAFGLPLTLGGAGALTFNVKGSKALSPSQPLGFTSAFPMRQLQLGLRLDF
jgi:hypothetical protein